jgi:ATP-dependent exoDNAse (exonuclease V) alpha subunit
MSWTGYGINWNNDHLIPVKFYEECKKEGEIVKYRCGLEKQSIEKTIKLSITSKKKIIELFKSWDNLRPLDINENSSKKEILTRETQEYLAKHIKEFQEILRKESEEKFKESEDRRRTKREKIFKIKKLKEEDFLEEVRKVLGKTPEDEIYSMFLRSDTTTNDMPSPLQEEEEEIEVSDEQREIYNQIMNVHCAFLTGPAGTGKTRLLHYIAKKNPGLAKLATTGRAANNILGQTVHSFFCLNEQGHSNLFNMKGRRDYISTHSMIIIDEVSMLPPKILDKIDSLLRIIHNNDKPFGGVKIIVCGDLLQIPPIKADPVFRAGAWKHFKIFELQRNYRQEKKEFQEVLSNIRLREPTDEEIKFLIEKSKKSVKKKICPFIICPTKKQTEEHNKKSLGKLKRSEETIRMEKTTTQWCNTVFEYEETNLLNELKLKIGARVMITSNLLQHLGIVNGTVALVKGFVKEGERVSRIQLLTLGRELEIPRIHRFQKNKKHKAWEKFSQFPLCLAYAITVHKAQGLSLNEAIVVINNMFSKGQLYTALSRVKEIRNLELSLGFERDHNINVEDQKKQALRNGWKVCEESLKQYQEMRKKN